MPLWGKWRGKSTFIKVITGVHQPEEGTMKLDGQPVQFKSHAIHRGAGIVCVTSIPQLIRDLSVTENIFLGHEITKGK